MYEGRPTYPQRDAVLTALRGLTGKDAGYATEAWRQLYPQAEREAEVARSTEELVSAPDSQRDAALARLLKAGGRRPARRWRRRSPA
jgi:hypothetical protein